MVPYTVMHLLSRHIGLGITHAMQGMVAQVQAQPGTHPVLMQSPDGRGLRPPYPPSHHPPVPYGQHSPMASAPPAAGQHLMMVVPHSPQVNAAQGRLGAQLQKQCWFSD